MTLTSSTHTSRPGLHDMIRTQATVKPDDPDTSRRLLRILTATMAAGYTAATVRDAVEHLKTPGIAGIPAETWHALAATAAAYIRQAHTKNDAGLERKFLRAWTGRLVAPGPAGLTPTETRALRMTALRIAAHQHTLMARHAGYDRIMVTRGWLAAAAGISTATAKKRLRLLEGVDWMRVVGVRGGARLWRWSPIGQAPKARAAAADLADLVGITVGGAGPLAEALHHLDSPWWWMRAGAPQYAPLVAVGEILTPGKPLPGWTESQWEKLSLGMDAATGSVWRDPARWGDLIDRLGDDAAAEYGARKAQHVQASALHRAQLQAARDAKLAAGREWLSVRCRVGDPPTADDREAASRWVQSATQTIRDHGLTPGLTRELRAVMRRRGWTDDMADKTLAWWGSAR